MPTNLNPFANFSSEPAQNPDMSSPDDMAQDVVTEPEYQDPMTDVAATSDSTEDDELSELERTDVDDVFSIKGEPGEDDELSELERTDLDDILDMNDDSESERSKKKVVRKQQFQRTARPYYPPTIGIQGVQ